MKKILILVLFLLSILSKHSSAQGWAACGSGLEHSAEVMVEYNGGRVVEKKTISDLPDNQQLTTGNLSNGIYFIQLVSDKNSVTQKFIVQH